MSGCLHSALEEEVVADLSFRLDELDKSMSLF